ncbi:hypothetical protein ACPA1T_10825 [Bacillus amyloliquefaciens]|uniref:hypothetical protein n=1 Tax=Bacillus amyloliquefaciens TaxID=1390 RepID=UPI003C72267D
MDIIHLLIFSAVFVLFSLMFQVFAVNFSVCQCLLKTETDKRHTSIDRNFTAYYRHRSGDIFQ